MRNVSLLGKLMSLNLIGSTIPLPIKIMKYVEFKDHEVWDRNIDKFTIGGVTFS